MTTAAAADARLVVRAQQGDLDAFAALFKRHFDSVHDYVSRLAKDPLLAADVTRDTFLSAMRQVGQLDEPERFRVWLYATARALAIGRLEAERESPLAADLAGDSRSEVEVVIDLDLIDDAGEAGEIEEVAELVWDAAASLSETEYTVLDLTARHRLSSSELGNVTGMDEPDAEATVDWLLDQVSDRITTYLLMMRGARACPRLGEIVGERTEPPNSTLRSKIKRHARTCDACTATRSGLSSPPEVMAALATISAPEIVYARTWENIESRWKTEGARPRSNRSKLRASALGVAVALLLGLGVAGAVQTTDSAPEAADTGGPNENSGITGQDQEGPVPLAAASTTTSVTSMPLTTTTLGPKTTTPSPPPPTPPPATTSTTLPTATSTTTTTPTTTTTVASTTTTTAPAPTTTTLPANQAPTVTVTSPANGEHFKSSQPLAIALGASVGDDLDSALVAEWYEGSNYLGSGNTVTFNFAGGCPSPISYTVTATVTDSSGLTASDSVTFTVGCGPTA